MLQQLIIVTTYVSSLCNSHFVTFYIILPVHTLSHFTLYCQFTLCHILHFIASVFPVLEVPILFHSLKLAKMVDKIEFFFVHGLMSSNNIWESNSPHGPQSTCHPSPQTTASA